VNSEQVISEIVRGERGHIQPYWHAQGSEPPARLGVHRCQAELVTVVILSAFVPTLIAQQLFQPAVLDTEEEEALGEEDLSIMHHRNRPAPATGDYPGTAADQPGG
jgi:hypothetical protein